MVQWLRLIQSKSKVEASNSPITRMTIDLNTPDDSDELKGRSDDKLELTDATTIRYHVYRMYFMGLNSSNLPWIVPLEDIPIGALSAQDQSMLESVIAHFQGQL